MGGDALRLFGGRSYIVERLSTTLLQRSHWLLFNSFLLQLTTKTKQQVNRANRIVLRENDFVFSQKYNA